MPFKIQCTNFVTTDCLQKGISGAAPPGDPPLGVIDMFCLPTKTTYVLSPPLLAGTDVDFAVIPQGIGAFQVAIPDGTPVGGDCRGDNAIDLQMSRTLSAQIASGNNSFVGGGADNTANADGSVVVGGGNTGIGGAGNTASGIRSFIGSGGGNTASNFNSFVGSGSNNTASGFGSFIGSGSNNTANGISAFIGSGSNNTASTNNAGVVGGTNNTASGASTFVGAGVSNTAGGDRTVICGGSNNNASGPAGSMSVVVGGRDHLANGLQCTVVGGSGNTAVDQGQGGSTVVGGVGNTASHDYSVVGGGLNNTASGQASMIMGGIGNISSGANSIVCGGNNNNVSGSNSVILGGSNQALADNDYTLTVNQRRLAGMQIRSSSYITASTMLTSGQEIILVNTSNGGVILDLAGGGVGQRYFIKDVTVAESGGGTFTSLSITDAGRPIVVGITSSTTQAMASGDGWEVIETTAGGSRWIVVNT